MHFRCDPVARYSKWAEARRIFFAHFLQCPPRIAIVASSFFLSYGCFTFFLSCVVVAFRLFFLRASSPLPIPLPSGEGPLQLYKRKKRKKGEFEKAPARPAEQKFFLDFEKSVLRFFKIVISRGRRRSVRATDVENEFPRSCSAWFSHFCQVGRKNSKVAGGLLAAADF